MKETYMRRRECEKFDHIIHTFPGQIIVYDTETTGIHPTSDYIVQISAIRLVRGANGNYQIRESFDQYIRPSCPMPSEISKINHITDEMLADKPSEAEIFPKIREFFWEVETGAAVMIGYNCTRFDNLFMNAMYMRQAGVSFSPVATVDAFLMTKELVQKADLPNGSMKLEHVAKLYGVCKENLHNSSVDTVVTGALAFRLYEDYIDHYKQPYVPKPRIRITGMYQFKKSKQVNYVMISGSLVLENGAVLVGKIRYDIWNKCYEDTEGELLKYGDFIQFEKDANEYAKGDITKYKN